MTSICSSNIVNLTDIKQIDLHLALSSLKAFFCVQTCRRTEEGLAEEECNFIYPLIYDARKAVASAAGAFLYDK